MSNHFYPFVSLLTLFFIGAGALSRRYPGLLRLFGVAGGLLMVGMGLSLPRFFPGLAPSFAVWAFIACGVMLMLGGAFDWLPTVKDDAPLRPATGRPPRHFGEAP